MYVNTLKIILKSKKDMTLLVRQLPPSPDGLPIEIYVFTNDTNWIVYEDIQADIFDHLLAAVNLFDLDVFQHPTGTDIKKTTIKFLIFLPISTSEYLWRIINVWFKKNLL